MNFMRQTAEEAVFLMFFIFNRQLLHVDPYLWEAEGEAFVSFGRFRARSRALNLIKR